MIHQEANAWLLKIFSAEDLSDAELLRVVFEMTETAELTSGPEFLFELSKLNSEAAFLFWQMNLQKKLSAWAKKYTSSKFHFVTTHLYPVIDGAMDTIILYQGKAYKDVAFKRTEQPSAFRRFEWREVEFVNSSPIVFNYEENELKAILKEELKSSAVIVAGIKNKSYQLAFNYANERIQGGRLIKDWSLVQNLLGELFLSMKLDEVLVNKITIESALSILKTCDQFVSHNMQVFGGAGYTEDYIVERLYRECNFLKNWPKPFKLELINHYQQEVLHL